MEIKRVTLGTKFIGILTDKYCYMYIGISYSVA